MPYQGGELGYGMAWRKVLLDRQSFQFSVSFSLLKKPSDALYFKCPNRVQMGIRINSAVFFTLFCSCLSSRSEGWKLVFSLQKSFLCALALPFFSTSSVLFSPLPLFYSF